MPGDPRPPISIVVPTRGDWPLVKPVVDALRTQIIAVDAELVIIDGTTSGSGFDRQQAGIPSPLTRVVPSPGSDIFELRALGMAEARGHVVAMTEDHCVPAPDYVAAVLRAHDEHAEQAVAGAVTNGSPDRLIDRANFLLVHARNLPPRDTLPEAGWIPTASNISYKRDAVPLAKPDRGWLETQHNVELLFANEVVFDDRIVVRHVQSTGRFGTLRNHFHAGKSMGGLGRNAIEGRRAQLRWAGRLVVNIPTQLVRPVWQLQRRSAADRRAVLPLLPIVVVVSAADAVGFACGVLTGPGRSPDLLR
jgi:hypothetical protein